MFQAVTGIAFLLLAVLVGIELVTLLGNWLNSLGFIQGLFGIN